MDTTYLVFVEPVDEVSGMFVGALPVPPCFRPTDTFIDIVQRMGLQVCLQTEDDLERTWGGPVLDIHVENAQSVMDAVRYVKSTLN